MEIEVGTLIGIVVNVISVVGVVLLNKSIASVSGFNFMICLSFFHFLFTMVGMKIMLRFNFFEFKAAAYSNVLPVALGSVGSVAFMNLNLAYNSVGFYQISKLACIPVTIFIQFAWYGQVVPNNIKITLVPILIGMFFATVYDVQFNFIGSICAMIAVVFTALSQIFTNRYSKALNCDALQLLYHTSPIMTLAMFFMIPLLDDFQALQKFEWNVEVIISILVSCVLALAVNISNYLVLSKTSPLTYQVLGHLKTILVIILGFVLFGNQLNFKNIFGITMALGGVIAYTEIKRQASNIHLPTQNHSKNKS